jgi:RimJ/RimL family protein N-acetyltransferase
MIRFREIELDDAELILDWRTKDRVTKFMNSDVSYDVNMQKKWLAGSFRKHTYYHWIIQYGNNDVGLLNLVDWDSTNKTTSWGFYIGDDSALGIGGIVPSYFYNFAFDILGVDTITAEVFYNNIKTIELHLAQGYSFAPHRDHVISKDSKEILMVCMLLKKEVFKGSKLSRLKADFPISKWDGNPLRN